VTESDKPTSGKGGSFALTEKDREMRLILAASRGVFVALKAPAVSLGDAARQFRYEPRTFEGDAFETAFEWARDENDRSEIREADYLRRLNGDEQG
jgi:hypothetical protein